jgi:myo-inositol-1-phosphate synthase
MAALSMSHPAPEGDGRARLEPPPGGNQAYFPRIAPLPMSAVRGIVLASKETYMGLKKGVHVEPASGKLGVLIPGLGAVATTTIAGCLAVRRGLAKPIGSLCEMGTIRLGKRTDDRVPRIRDYVPLATLDDLVFGGWDIFPDNAYQAAVNCGVLDAKDLEPIRDELEAIEPMPAVFAQEFVKKLHGTHVKQASSKMELAEAVIADIEGFKQKHGCDRMVVIWCGSTEVYKKPTDVHASIEAFEDGLRQSDPAIAPSQIYAYAAIKLGIPYVNGAPNLSADIPALLELARETSTPLAGKDFKTGQTLLKTILAPGFKARLLGIEGWYSTNILGNRDGEVLDDPESFKSKEHTKLGVLDHILQPDKYPDLYKDLCHVVRINYYPPRGDNKEGWDNIDIRGWLGYPMQIKVNFLCRDSILAAPIVLDLALFMDFAQRAGMRGIQEWLSFYFKSPMTPQGVYPEHDLFIQLMKLKNTLRHTRGDDLITHLGAEYYD